MASMALGWENQELYCTYPEESDVSTTVLVSVPTISALTSDLEILEVTSKMKSHFILLAGTYATL